MSNATERPMPEAQAQTKERSLLDQIAEQQARDATRYQPVMSVDDSIKRYQAIQKFMNECMADGVDYGKPPGFPAEAKPFLYKAGAQKLCAFFGYVPHYETQERIEEWTPEKYGEALFYFRFNCVLSKNGEPVGEGIGSCNSWETKYRYRNASRTCPDCGASAIIKGKAEYGGGFICFAKKGGCGAKFKDDDSRMQQEVGKVPNPDIADVVNTVQKMAEKRAYVEATLSATGASAFFSQDEDVVEPPPPQREQRQAPKRESKPKQAPKPPEHVAEDDMPPPRPVPDELKIAVEKLREGDHSLVAKTLTFIQEECITSGCEAAFQKLSGELRQQFPKGGPKIPDARMERFWLDVWDELTEHRKHQAAQDFAEEVSQ